MNAADYLHAQIFGRHRHVCPECKREKVCRTGIDCQPGEQWCADCAYANNHRHDEEEAA